MAGFGFSVGDIVLLTQITKRTYRRWKAACGEYTQITADLRSLRGVLITVEDEARTPASLLFRSSTQSQRLGEIVRNCHSVVAQLQNVVVQFRSLEDGATSRRRNWDRLRLDNAEIGDLRAKLSLHMAALTNCLNVIGIGALGRIDQRTDQLESMKKTIDEMAAQIRRGARQSSIMTSYDDDDTEVWRQFRRELIGEGFSSDAIRELSPRLKSYLRSLKNDGRLDEAAPDSLQTPHSLRTPHSLQTPHSPQTPPSEVARGEEVPDSAESLDTGPGMMESHDLALFKAMAREFSTATARSDGSLTEIGDQADDSALPIDRWSSVHEALKQTVLPSKSLAALPPSITSSPSDIELCEVQHMPPVQLLPGCHVETLHNTLYVINLSGSPSGKKFFWLSAAADGILDTPGYKWQRVESVLGRVQWPRGESGTLSYKHPLTSDRYFTVDGDLFVVHWSNSSDRWGGASNNPDYFPQPLQDRSLPIVPMSSDRGGSSDNEPVVLQRKTRRRHNGPRQSRRPLQLLSILAFAGVVASAATKRAQPR